MTDGILIAPREKMIEWAYFHGRHPYKYLVDKRTGCDIDDGSDLACARAWLDMDESVSLLVRMYHPNDANIRICDSCLASFSVD